MLIFIDNQCERIAEENETDSDKTLIRGDNNENKEDFNISGPIDNISSLPIFKLLQLFKLQQYAKSLTELGFGFEIYKLWLINETSKYNLINKLNLMPGHKARFSHFFESISKTFVKEEKPKSQQRQNNDQLKGSI